VEAVAPQSPGLESMRDRQQRGHPGQVAMELRVEAGELRQLGQRRLGGFHQADLHRQVIRIHGFDALEVGQQRRRDALGIEMIHSVHDAMPDRGQVIALACLPQPLHERVDRLAGVARRDRLTRPGRQHAVDRQVRIVVPDAFHSAAADRCQAVVRLHHRETDAG